MAQDTDRDVQMLLDLLDMENGATLADLHLEMDEQTLAAYALDLLAVLGDGTQGGK